MLAALTITTAVNAYGLRLLPVLEVIMLVLHVAGFLAILLPLWIKGKIMPVKELFFTFEDQSNWESITAACLVGLFGPTLTLGGGDCIVHLGEETKDAAKAIPLAMVASAAVNSIVGFLMTITILAVSGDFDNHLAVRTGQPYLAIVYAATSSSAATVTLITVLIILFFCCTVNNNATASRQLFAFSRDRGMPGSSWISKVDHHRGIPLNSLIVTSLITFALTWVASNSTIAFNNILSISLVGELLSYASTVTSIALRRARQPPLPSTFLRWPTPIGYFINGVALCYLAITLVMIFFPVAPRPTAASMNWSIVIGGGVIVLAILYYLLRGRKTFIDPASRIKDHHRIDELHPITITAEPSKRSKANYEVASQRHGVLKSQ